MISPGGIAAIVGEEVITYGDLDRKVEAFIKFRIGDQQVPPDYIEQVRPRLREKILEELIEQSLLLQEAEHLKIQIVDLQIDDEINERMNRERQNGKNIHDIEEYYQLVLEDQKITRQEYREQVRKEMQAMTVLWKEAWPGREFISPGELREYYQRNRAQFQTPSDLSFRMILVKNDEYTAQVLASIDEELDRGVPFEDVARKYSAVSRDDGGLFNKKFDDLKEWPLKLRENLKTMQPGDVRRRILTPRGWFYLKMLSVKSGKTLPFERVQEVIKLRILSQRREQDRIKYVDKLRGKYNVQNMLPDAIDEAPKLAESKPEKPRDPTPGDRGSKPEIRDVSPEPAPKKPPEPVEPE